MISIANQCCKGTSAALLQSLVFFFSLAFLKLFGEFYFACQTCSQGPSEKVVGFDALHHNFWNMIRLVDDHNYT